MCEKTFLSKRKRNTKLLIFSAQTGGHEGDDRILFGLEGEVRVRDGQEEGRQGSDEADRKGDVPEQRGSQRIRYRISHLRFVIVFCLRIGLHLLSLSNFQ